MRNNFSLGDLEAFVAVGHHLNFRTAARSLNISPSALTRRIQKLETTLDTRLLVRTTRGVRLTISGMQIYARSQELMADLGELLDASQAGRRFLHKITIACTYSISQTLVPVAIKRFSQAFPNVFVEVLTPGPTEVLDHVRRGVADFGITDMGLKDPSLEFQPLFEELVVLAAPTTHRFSTRREVRWVEITKEPFVAVTKRSPLRVLLDFELSKARINISICHEVGNIHSALKCVAVGLGVTAATELSVSTAAASVVAVPLASPEISCSRALIRPRDKFMRPAVNAFWHLLSEELDDIKRLVETEVGRASSTRPIRDSST